MTATTTVDTTATTVDETVDTSATEAANTIKAKPLNDRSKERELEQAFDDLAQARELNAGYAEAGPFYAAKPPVANAVGGEIGIVTKDEKAGTVQRTGIGFYVRSDHFFGHTYSTSVPLA